MLVSGNTNISEANVAIDKLKSTWKIVAYPDYYNTKLSGDHNLWIKFLFSLILKINLIAQIIIL